MRVLVTGGTGGVGSAIVKAFEAEGARVVASSRSGGIRGSVARDAERIVERAAREMKGLDVLVNCAGVSDPEGWSAGLLGLKPKLWRAVLETDLWGSFACARAAARRMKAGAIVNVGSIPALVGDVDGLVYSVAKGGVIAMTKTLAARLAPRIRVNCLALGSIETGWVRWLTPRQKKSYVDAIPVGRFGRPEEAAEAALFLAKNTWTTGQTLVLDGGETLA